MTKTSPEIQRLSEKGFPSLLSLEDRFSRAIFYSEPLRRFQRMAPNTFQESRRIVLEFLHNFWKGASLPSNQGIVSIGIWKLTDPQHNCINANTDYLWEFFERLLREEYAWKNDRWIASMSRFLHDAYAIIADHVQSLNIAFPLLASQQSIRAADRLSLLFSRQFPLRLSARSFEEGEIIDTVDFSSRTGLAAGVMGSGLVRIYDLSGKIIAHGSGFAGPRWKKGVGAGFFSDRGDRFIGYDRDGLRAIDISSSQIISRPIPSFIEGILLKKHGHLQKNRWFGWQDDYNPFLFGKCSNWELRSVTEGPSGKLLGLFQCHPEMGVLLKSDGSYVFSTVGDACCGHMEKILELNDGYVKEDSHGRWLGLVKTGKKTDEIIQLEKHDTSRCSSDPMTGTINGTRWFFATCETLSCYEGAGLAWRKSTFHLMDVILTLAADAVGNILAVGTAGGGLHILDQNGEIISTTVMNWPVTALTVSPDGKRIIAGCAGGGLHAYEFV
jgi:hypothetical protein